MNKKYKSISNPDELNKYLQHTSFISWIILGFVMVVLLLFFVWTFIFKIEVKLQGKAEVNDGYIQFYIDENDFKKISVGNKVYIAGKESTIVSVENKNALASKIDLADGEYTYVIVIKEMRPIDFLIGS